MILVDTTVWVDHLRGSEPTLVSELGSDSVIMHSMVIGELACGNLSNREARIRDWHTLPAIEEQKNKDVLTYIEERKLMGRGIGLIDVHLLNAVENHGSARLWTRDKKLLAVAKELGLAYTESG